MRRTELAEEQIQRYSRQILLGEVGGGGQLRLLSTAVEVRGEGAALWAAAAYLAASGAAVSSRAPSPVRPGEEGFLFAAADVGADRPAALERALRELNPDAVPPPGARPSVVLVAAPGEPEVEVPCVALGSAGGRAALAFRAAGGCAGCFARTARSMSAPPAGAAGVLAGTLAAVAALRIALDLSEPLGGLAVEEGGALRPLEVQRCDRCR